MDKKPLISIVLYAPDIPGNTGSIGRTCIALGARLVLIKPYGFDLSEKAVRRAGLDYWKDVDLTEYNSWEDFLQGEKPAEENLFFFTKTSKQYYFDQNYSSDSYIVFGSETRGLPQHIFETYNSRLYGVPMYSEHVRSLNLSNVATTVAYEALRKIKF